jgi:hypothetical protein
MKKIGIAGLTLMIVAAAEPTLAYIGPGAGVTVIGAVFGIAATFAVVIFSLVWYPVRRLRAKRKREIAEAGTDGEAGDKTQPRE